jgi:5-amino-6-(5-phospho-D-ribitylamino)uracil phosphatase
MRGVDHAARAVMNSASSARKTPSVGPIKLIAIDLDGTLLTTDKRISEPTLGALKCLPTGVKVVIASARPPRSVRAIYQLLGLDTWQINYNGALIWDEPGQRPVFHRPMAGELARRVIETARDMFEEVLVSCEILDRWHTDRPDDANFTTETGKLFAPDVVAPYSSFCNQPVTKLMLLGDPKLLVKLEPILFERFGEQLTVLQTDEHLLQIMDKRVSKAVALKKLAHHYRVPARQIMAIGDAPNDVGMLQLAGVAVAMDNASPVVKKVAHWVAPSNDDHGVHAALLRYGLCSGPDPNGKKGDIPTYL